MKILGIGNALVDIMVKLPDGQLLSTFQLRKGSMQLVDSDSAGRMLAGIAGREATEVSGGSAANTVCGLAAMGVESAFYGVVGRDAPGAVFRSEMEKAGVRPLLQTGRGMTGHALTLVTPDGERTFATCLGASGEMEPGDLHGEMLRGYTDLYVEGYLVQHHELIRRALELAAGRGMQVSLDLASFNVVEDNREFLRFLIREYADVVFANEDEARAYSGVSDPLKALDLLAQGCRIAVVKVGREGSWVQSGRDRFHVRAAEARCVVDTTGAGDLYAAGFLYGLHHGLRLPLCAEVASTVAAAVIGAMGARIPADLWPEVQRQVKQVVYKQLEG